MTYPEAQKAFEDVARIDPDCAMAQWGVAMTLFQPLWPARPNADARQRGWSAVQKAKTLQPQTERERLYIEMAESFFLEPASIDYWLRINRWEQASGKLHAAFPDDPEAAVLYALAVLATTPAGEISRDHADRAAAILLRVHQRYPDHPGAMHYLIHANDTPGREHESLGILRKYEAAAPHNPHALHMPTHIYTRLGNWDAAVRGNLLAATVALDHPAGDRGQYVWDEFPHAIEYLVYAYLQKGADDMAHAQIERLHATANVEPTFKGAFHWASTQSRYALERRAWTDAEQIVAREPASFDWNRFPWPEAIVRFARGLGAARLGNLDTARAESVRLDALEAVARKDGEDLFARNIRVLSLELNGWIAYAEGRNESSVALLGEAAELEASTPKHAVTPGPTLPAYEQLGDLLMELKRPGEALVAYERSSELYPRRFNGLLGSARAAGALGDQRARTYCRALIEIADGGTRRAAIEEARECVARR